MIPCNTGCCVVSDTLCDVATGGRVFVALDISEGTTTYYNENGTPWVGDPATGLQDCVIIPDETPLVVTTEGNSTGVSQSGTVDHIVNITLLGTGAGQLLTLDPNGGLFLDCDAIAGCVTIPDITSDGDTLGVTVSGGTTDIVVTSTDPDNEITIGSDGGSYFNLCDAIKNVPQATDTAVPGVGIELFGVNVVTGECERYFPQEDCCFITAQMCDPANDETVLVAIDTSGGPSSYYTQTGAAWAGDPTTLEECGAGAEFNKVALDGSVSPFDPAADCVPEFAFQQIVDHHADTVDAASKSTVLELHRSLVIGDGHVGGATGVGAAKFIGVSHSDSDDAGITGITNHHFYAVSTSINSTATGLRSHVIASRDSEATGQETGVFASVRSGATGDFIATVVGSVDAQSSEFASGNYSSIRTTSSGVGASNVSSSDSAASGQSAGNYSSNVSSATGRLAVNVGSEDGRALATGTGNYSSLNAEVTDIYSANIGSVEVQNDGSNSVIESSNIVSIAGGVTKSSIQSSGDVAILSGYATSSQMTIDSTGEGAELRGTMAGIFSSGFSSQDSRIPAIYDAGQSAVIATGGSQITGSAGNPVNRSAIVSGDRHDMQAFNSFMAAGQNGLVTDHGSVSFCGGQATTGGVNTFAHGSSNTGFQGAINVGFRGAVPQPARAVTTLADVILALQEQGLVI